MWSPPSSPPPNSPPPPYSNSNSNNNSNRPYSIIDLFKAFRRHDEDEISLHLHEFPANGGIRDRTILMEAILLRNPAMVHYLLTESEPADPNKVTHLGPALFVVNPHDIQIYKHLLDAGADPTKRWNGLTIIDRIIITPGAEEAAEFFLKKGILPNATYIYQAIESSSDEILNLLFNYVDLSSYTDFISYLIRRKNPALLRQVVESDLEFKTHPAEPAVLTAILTGELELLSILLETGKFDLNRTEENTVVHAVIDRNRPDMLDLLFRAGLPPRSAYLRYAIEKKAFALANLIVAEGGKLSQTDENEVVVPMIDRDDVEMMEFLHDSGIVEFTRADLQYAIEKSKTGVSLKLISYDIPINTRILYTAADKGNVEVFEILMNRDLSILRKKLSFKDNKTLFELAKSNSFGSDINQLILFGYRADTRYKGFTSGDMEMLNILFDRTAPVGGRSPAENFAICPVCLKFTERSSGCKYMLFHNCKSHGGYYHEELYEKFKSPEGYIYFCTVCGRICLGHRHYDLKDWDEDHTLMHNLPGADPFSNECKTLEHGGNFEEKMARFRKLRSVALAFQPLAGNALEKDVKDRIVEALWNPMTADANTAANLAAEAAGAWRISHTSFPNVPPIIINQNANMARWSEINVFRPLADRDLTPIPAGNGLNRITYEPGELFRFRHRQPDGSIYTHSDDSLVSKQGITTYIADEITKFGIPDRVFGKCFDSECGALLYPEEVQPFIDGALYNQYRRIFNWKHHELAENNVDPAAAAAAMPAAGAASAAGGAATGTMGGGGRSKQTNKVHFYFKDHKSKPGDFFQPMVDGACLIKPAGYKPGNALPMGKLRKTRKQKGGRRFTRRIR